MNRSNRIRLLRRKEKTAVIEIQQRAQKVVGYVRVSTEEQATAGHGLECTTEPIRSFCQSPAYELVEIVSEPAFPERNGPRTDEGFRRVLELAAAEKLRDFCWSGTSTG